MFIDPTTEAATRSITLRANQTLQLRGVIGAYTIPIEIPDGDGGWEPLVEDSETIQLDANNKQLTALGNTLVRVNKPITTVDIGIALI